MQRIKIVVLVIIHAFVNLTMCMSSDVEQFNVLVEQSKKFHAPLSFSFLDNRIEKIGGASDEIKEKIAQQAKSVRIIMHKNVAEQMIISFLNYKKSYGSSVEKILYNTLEFNDFIKRLFICRPLMFMLSSDRYILRDKTQGSGGFESIGTDAQISPLLLQDYLSYDEMTISALLGVSVPTMFINDGNRNNKAVQGLQGTYEASGVYTGLVGARFEKPGLMEWAHIIITPEQNTAQNGYGKEPLLTDKTKLLDIWSKFYGETFPTYEEAQSDATGRFIQLQNGDYFNIPVYKKRMRLVIEPYLLEANERGKEEQRQVYCHIVGLGLGVWQIWSGQAELILDVYADIIREHNLSWISDIDFSWFPTEYTSCGGVENGQIFKTDTNVIKIHFSKRNPAAKLIEKDERKLIVAQYAWDGNAYPGNEYWAKMFAASGDPAAACCSTISELQNPLINTCVIENKFFVTGSAEINGSNKLSSQYKFPENKNFWSLSWSTIRRNILFLGLPLAGLLVGWLYYRSHK